ncbi:hypothetical protein AZI11_08175 [Levilactobacillus brevis]|uniref:phage tail tube protein n=1 Tax=Levilactobacillus brevis TaxID=1580 RepID=UPI000A206147|nr:phage tail tube protein [Levilactobacillus brevis]ARN92879.1 hypothetical protein AZI11_08175 [Levilactobacillus brevis]ARN95522.1 hypothetical protein AZI12_08220 [Levilactobacillus brevis]
MTSSANGLVGTGTRLFMAEHGDLAFQEVANVKTTPEVGPTAQQLEITNLDDDNQRYVSGLGAISALTFTVIYKGPDWNKIYQKSGDKVAYDWKLIYPDGMYITFTGAVEIQLEPIDINTAATFNLTITPDNVPRFHKSNSTTDNAGNGDDSGGGGNGMSYRPMFVKSFDNVADMNAFDNSDDVLDQGDFVLISSNDGDNGKVYFYNGNGFTYFASIIGPQGDTGAKGDPGTDIKMMGAIDTLPALGQEGQCYFVSTTLYSWSSGKWINLGDFQGPKGDKGDVGPQGQQGIQGPKGATGHGLEIKGKVDTTSQLPATASEGDGYLVAEELYVWTDNEWKDCGQIQGPAGKDGKDGATGPQGIQGPKGDTGPAGNDGTAKYEELADNTDLFSLVVNDELAHYYLCGSNASAKTLKNCPVATAFSLQLSPANVTQSIATNNVPEWAYTQMLLQPFNSSTIWIASTNSDVDGNISNTSWVQVANMSDVTTAVSAATANMVSNVKGDTSWENIDGFKKFVHKPTDSEGYQFMTSADVNGAINPLEQKISDTGWQQLVSKDSSSAAFDSNSYYRIVNGVLYVHGTISVLNTSNLRYQLWDMPTGWSISDKAGTQTIYPDSTAQNNYVQLNTGGLLVYEDKTGYRTDFRFVSPVDKA